MICNNCPRRCNADRDKGYGFCGSPPEFKIARAALHYWEEPCISGTQGSGAIFFSGCNLRCVYCQNHEISTGGKGITVSDDKFIDICKRLIDNGAHNINLVTPSHYAYRLARVLSAWHCPVPVVYNTSGYDSTDLLKMLDGLVDIYLTDYKYSRSDKAERYSMAKDYPQIALNAVDLMRTQVKDCFDGDMMTRGVIIRHLILPSNTNSSAEVLNCLHNRYPDTYISLMAQYTPCGDIKNNPELNRRISKREYEKVVNYALSLNHKKLFLQDKSSANEEYIPPFDFTGVI